MLIDEQFLKPYVEAVKKTRALRYALGQVDYFHEQSDADIAIVDSDYFQAHSKLAEDAKTLAQEL